MIIYHVRPSNIKQRSGPAHIRPVMARTEYLTGVGGIRYNWRMSMDSLKIAYKVWLDCNGKAFGEGPDRLLQRVETTGSLHRAAADMKMSYRKAWVMLQTMERRLGFTLLERKVGGVSGGGSRLTPEARDFMKRYEAFRRDVEGSLQEICRKHFG